MLNIAVTTIDQFNRMLWDEDYTEAKLIEYITVKPAPSKFMELGTAFHDIIQNPDARLKYDEATDKHFFESKNGIVFPFEVITECYDYIDHNFPFEIRQEKIYTLASNEKVKVIGKADQLKGLEVTEIKSNWSVFDYDEYYKSCQWKYYMDLFDARRVNYKVFELKDTVKGGIELKGIHNFSFDRTQTLEDDILKLLSEFVDYIHSRELEKYFPERNK